MRYDPATPASGGHILRSAPVVPPALLARAEVAAEESAGQKAARRKATATAVIPTLHWMSGVLENDCFCVRLSWMKRCLLVALARGAGPDHSFGRLVQILWPNPDDEPINPHNLIYVHIRQMKDKLRMMGLEIVKREHGWGKWLEGDLHIDFHGVTKTRMPHLPYEGIASFHAYLARQELAA